MITAPRPVGLRRVIQVLLRSIHLAAMAVVLGGCFAGFEYLQLRVAVWTTLASGASLFAMDVIKGPEILHQGSGLFVFLKLGLLSLGSLFPHHRFGLYLAATLVASIGSHMPSAWRHYSVWYGREIEK